MVGVGLFNIIIVEDNSELRQGLGSAIIENAPDAIRIAPDLPREYGVAITKRVKLTYPRFVVRVLSGHVRNIDRKLAYEPGTDVCSPNRPRPMKLAQCSKTYAAVMHPPRKAMIGSWICAAIESCRQAGTPLNSLRGNVCFRMNLPYPPTHERFTARLKCQGRMRLQSKSTQYGLDSWSAGCDPHLLRNRLHPRPILRV